MQFYISCKTTKFTHQINCENKCGIIRTIAITVQHRTIIIHKGWRISNKSQFIETLKTKCINKCNCEHKYPQNIEN